MCLNLIKVRKKGFSILSHYKNFCYIKYAQTCQGVKI